MLQSFKRRGSFNCSSTLRRVAFQQVVSGQAWVFWLAAFSIWASACTSPNPPYSKDEVADAAPREAAPSFDSNSTTPYPVLIASAPKSGEVEVYPSPFGDGETYQFVAALSFSEAMNPSIRGVQLAAGDNRATDHLLEWKEGGTTATLSVNPPPLGVQILAEYTTYTLSFGELESAEGQPISTTLDGAEAHITFTTGAYDALLNHSCGHTVFGPFGAGIASAIDDDPTFTATATHTQYTLTLPAADKGHAGTIALNLPITGDYRLYFDTMVKLAAFASSLDVAKAADSCHGIQAQADITLEASVPVTLELAADSQQVNLIVESLAED